MYPILIAARPIAPAIPAPRKTTVAPQERAYRGSAAVDIDSTVALPMFKRPTMRPVWMNAATGVNCEPGRRDS